MPYRLTKPDETLDDASQPGYAEYGHDEAALEGGAAPSPDPPLRGHAGPYGQHDFTGAARRSGLRSDQRYHDSAADTRL